MRNDERSRWIHKKIRQFLFITEIRLLSRKWETRYERYCIVENRTVQLNFRWFVVYRNIDREYIGIFIFKMFHRRRTFFITRNVHRIFLNKVQNKNKKKKRKKRRYNKWKRSNLNDCVKNYYFIKIFILHEYLYFIISY